MVDPHDIDPSQTDWARVHAMTDEEIEATEFSDEGLADDWIERAIVQRDHRK